MLPIAHCDRLPVTYADHTIVMHDRSKDWWVRDYGRDMTEVFWPHTTKEDK